MSVAALRVTTRSPTDMVSAAAVTLRREPQHRHRPQPHDAQRERNQINVHGHNILQKGAVRGTRDRGRDEGGGQGAGTSDREWCSSTNPIRAPASYEV